MSLVKELFQRQVIVDGVIVDCLVNPNAKDTEDILDQERAHNPDGTKYSEDQPRDELGRFGEGGGGATGDGEDADAFTPVETSRYKISVSDKDYSKDGAKPGDPKRAKKTAEVCQKEIDGVLKQFPKLAKVPPVSIEISPTKNGVASVEKVRGPDGQREKVEKWTDEYGGMYTDAIEEGGLPTISIAQNKSTAEAPYKLGAKDVGNDAASLMRHEYGHHVHETFIPSKEQEWWMEEYISRIERVPTSDDDDVIPDKAALKKEFGQISMYAYTNPEEMFAESFCAYTHKDYGKEGMPRLPKNIEDRLGKLLGKRKGE